MGEVNFGSTSESKGWEKWIYACLAGAFGSAKPYKGVLFQEMGEVALNLTAKIENEKTEKCITHYRSGHKILVVGEGDFSFSASLARAFGSAKNMVATTLDSQDELSTKYGKVATCRLKQLKKLGCTVLQGVDVHTMAEHSVLKTMKFDRIIFNFPHAGHDPLYNEYNLELIRRHRGLLSGFFRNARWILHKNGEIHVSHRNDHPYDQWRVRRLATRSSLVLVRMVEFEATDYPGYKNKRGGDIRSNGTFPLGECYTFMFSLRKDFNAMFDGLHI